LSHLCADRLGYVVLAHPRTQRAQLLHERREAIAQVDQVSGQGLGHRGLLGVRASSEVARERRLPRDASGYQPPSTPTLERVLDLRREVHDVLRAVDVDHVALASAHRLELRDVAAIRLGLRRVALLALAPEDARE